MIFIISFDDFKRITNKITNNTSESQFIHPLFYHETLTDLFMYATAGDYIVYCTRLNKELIPNIDSFKLEFLPKVRTIELLEPLTDKKDLNITVAQV